MAPQLWAITVRGPDGWRYPVLDWAGLLANGPRWVDQARVLTHAGTEPVISPVRRVLQPVRASGLSIDLAFAAVFVVALILRSIAFSL